MCSKYQLANSWCTSICWEACVFMAYEVHVHNTLDEEQILYTFLSLETALHESEPQIVMILR